MAEVPTGNEELDAGVDGAVVEEVVTTEEGVETDVVRGDVRERVGGVNPALLAEYKEEREERDQKEETARVREMIEVQLGVMPGDVERMVEDVIMAGEDRATLTRQVRMVVLGSVDVPLGVAPFLSDREERMLNASRRFVEDPANETLVTAVRHMVGSRAGKRREVRPDESEQAARAEAPEQARGRTLVAEIERELNMTEEDYGRVVEEMMFEFDVEEARRPQVKMDVLGVLAAGLGDIDQETWGRMTGRERAAVHEGRRFVRDERNREFVQAVWAEVHQEGREDVQEEPVEQAPRRRRAESLALMVRGEQLANMLLMRWGVNEDRLNDVVDAMVAEMGMEGENRKRIMIQVLEVLAGELGDINERVWRNMSGGEHGVVLRGREFVDAPGNGSFVEAVMYHVRREGPREVRGERGTERVWSTREQEETMGEVDARLHEGNDNEAFVLRDLYEQAGIRSADLMEIEDRYEVQSGREIEPGKVLAVVYEMYVAEPAYEYNRHVPYREREKIQFVANEYFAEEERRGGAPGWDLPEMDVWGEEESEDMFADGNPATGRDMREGFYDGTNVVDGRVVRYGNEEREFNSWDGNSEEYYYGGDWESRKAVNLGTASDPNMPRRMGMRDWNAIEGMMAERRAEPDEFEEE